MTESASLALDHEVPLEDLTPATEYFFRAKAATAAGTTFYSEINSFETLAATPTSLVNVGLASAGTTVVGRSSNYGGAADDDLWGARSAIDGQMATEWATQNDGDDAFLELDLGQERTIVSIALRSREMSDGSSIITSFELSTLDRTVGPLDTPDPSSRYVFEISPPLVTRSVRFAAVSTTGGNTGLRELELLVEAP
jgi:hypothetical protein